MQDLKRGKRKTLNKQHAPMTNDLETVEILKEEDKQFNVTRGCKPKYNPCEHDDCGCSKPHKHEHDDCGCSKPHKHEHECECHCECHYGKKDCEPCDIESKTCFENHCGTTKCCGPILPQNINVSNCVPYAIEASRIFDTFKFQTFTDATDADGNPVDFEIEVVEVDGSVPKGVDVGITIEKICINYDKIRIIPGNISLEEYDVEPLQKRIGINCQDEFEYAVCGDRDKECCCKGKGKSVAYKQRGLIVEVSGLVLELRGKCGCTEVVALAYPIGKEECACDEVRFPFSTLSAIACLPACGESSTLKQLYQTSLTVDCIGKCLLSCNCCDGETYYCLEIPNGIDLILCLQEIVIVSVQEQIVVLGAQQAIKPRVVDNFSKVCEFDNNHCDCETIIKRDGHCGCNN